MIGPILTNRRHRMSRSGNTQLRTRLMRPTSQNEGTLRELKLLNRQSRGLRHTNILVTLQNVNDDLRQLFDTMNVLLDLPT